MFGNCCGRKKSKEKEKKSFRDAETQSTSDLLTIVEQNTVVAESDKLLVTDQPTTKVPQENQNHRQSVISEIKIEISDNDDDDVFCEGLGPPIKLAENLGTPEAKPQQHVPLPKWFSQEEDDDAECGGTQEPPATPIGKDELALRRHRFFSELLSAAQNATEHKVHFDPLGPVIAGAEFECRRYLEKSDSIQESHQNSELENLVTRLESVTTRLESVCLPVQELLKLTSSCTTPDTDLEAAVARFLEEPDDKPTIKEPVVQTEIKEVVSTKPEEPVINMSVQGYSDLLQGPLAHYLSLSESIGGDVATHSKMVSEAFKTQLEYIKLASQSKQPGQNEINSLIKPTADCIMKIQEFREKNRGSQYFNHLSAISESIPALGWVAVSPTPGPYVKEMNDAGQFYTNRVLKDWKEKNMKHMEWVKAWIQTLSDLQSFVKQHHTTGLVWSGKGAAPAGAPIPPPPGCPPPPPAPLCDLSAAGDNSSNDHSALFAQINQGENITKSLKKVTADMQTHKNPTLRQGPAPFKAPTAGNMSAPVAPIEKAPSFVRDGKKWLIEYQKSNHNLLVEGAEMNNVVYLYKCSDSTVVVKGKINSITLDSCKKTSVVFDSVVSCIEFINCQSVQMQVLAKVPTISIDKTDGCQVYLSSDALDVEIVSSKSSEMNILVPNSNGDYAEYPVPEQYKTVVVPGKGLSTTIVENKG